MSTTLYTKPQRSFWQIWNMSFGFFGIQFGWGLQMANMSAIYEWASGRIRFPSYGWRLRRQAFHPADHWACQRPHVGTAGAAAAVFPGGRDPRFADADPYAECLGDVLHMTEATGRAHAVPPTVRVSYYIGAAVYLGAVLWTVVTTPEYPAGDLEAFRQYESEESAFAANAREIFREIAEMPQTMRMLGPVQLFTFLGLFCKWLYFPLSLTG